MAEMIKHPSVEIISGLARERAVNHILNVLDYDNFLCQCIKSYVDFRSGKVFAVSPPNIDLDNIVDFSWGYGRGTDNSLPARILKTIKLYPRSVVVFDDVMAESVNEDIQGSCIASDNEVYHWIRATEANELNVANLVMQTAVSWHFLCVVFIPDSNIDVKDCIIQSRCDAFKSVIEVVVGAFDGEGYIHWSPNYIGST
jgi:hypothetical protein